MLIKPGLWSPISTSYSIERARKLGGRTVGRLLLPPRGVAFIRPVAAKLEKWLLTVKGLEFHV